CYGKSCHLIVSFLIVSRLYMQQNYTKTPIIVDFMYFYYYKSSNGLLMFCRLLVPTCDRFRWFYCCYVQVIPVYNASPYRFPKGVWRSCALTNAGSRAFLYLL